MNTFSPILSFLDFLHSLPSTEMNTVGLEKTDRGMFRAFTPTKSTLPSSSAIKEYSLSLIILYSILPRIQSTAETTNESPAAEVKVTKAD